MIDFFREGGAEMWVVLALGVVALGVAVSCIRCTKDVFSD
jgi:hypothetical protein